MSKPLCIYHGNCPDGFASAYVVNKHFKGEVNFMAGTYGTGPDWPLLEWDMIDDRVVFFVDFCYPADIMAEIAVSAKSVVILDHHKTAFKNMVALGGQLWTTDTKFGKTIDVYILDHLGDNVTFYYGSNGYSGVGVTWDYFFPHDELPHVLKCVQDRDVWQWEIEHSNEICKGLDLHKYDFNLWEVLVNKNPKKLYEDGKIIARYEEHEIENLIETSWKTINTDLYGEIPFINCPIKWVSECGNKLSKYWPFVILYSFTKDHIVCSLRSSGDKADCAEIAQKFGGGGHKNAAGFSLDMDAFSNIEAYFDMVTKHKKVSLRIREFKNWMNQKV